MPMEDTWLSPSKAIRNKCLECVGEQTNEILKCTASDEICKLWPYRLGGKADKRRSKTVPTRIKLIKQECLLCMGCPPRSVKEANVFVRECTSEDCSIWHFRMGKNPARKGKGNPNFNKK